jgi:hypothetical protein
MTKVFRGGVVRLLALAWIGGIVLAGTCFGAEAQSQPASDFSKGTFAITVLGEYARDFNGSKANIESGSVGVGYFFTDNISLNVELSGFAVQEPGPDSIITGGDLLIRHHFIRSGRFSLYIDVAGGLTYGTQRTPPGGTNFNFELESGPGIAWRLRDRLFLMGGARYLHFSTAAIDGHDRNPSVNAVAGYVGLMYTF